MNIKNSFLSEKSSFYEDLVDPEDVRKLWIIRKNWKNNSKIKLIKLIYSFKENILK